MELETVNTNIEEHEKTILTMDEISTKYKYVIIGGSAILAVIITVHIIRNKH